MVDNCENVSGKLIYQLSLLDFRTNRHFFCANVRGIKEDIVKNA